tara:strand:- start:307 stop:516 length:210 start_codon:yes stop_codon:yes gene_type:complete
MTPAIGALHPKGIFAELFETRSGSEGQALQSTVPSGKNHKPPLLHRTSAKLHVDIRHSTSVIYFMFTFD